MRCRLRQRSRAYPHHFAAEKLITRSTTTRSNFQSKTNVQAFSAASMARCKCACSGKANRGAYKLSCCRARSLTVCGPQISFYPVAASAALAAWRCSRRWAELRHWAAPPCHLITTLLQPH